MFLILPDSLDPGIQSMEANLTTDTIKALMTTLQVMHLNFSSFSLFRTKWWMWKCRVSKSKQPATLTKRSEASGWRQSSRQEWPTSPTWCAGTLSTSPSSATGSHFRPRTLDLRGYFRAKIETKEWGRHGINASNQKQKVGILKQKYFEVHICSINRQLPQTIIQHLPSLCAITINITTSIWPGWPSLPLLCVGLLHRDHPLHGQGDPASCPLRNKQAVKRNLDSRRKDTLKALDRHNRDLCDQHSNL